MALLLLGPNPRSHRGSPLGTTATARRALVLYLALYNVLGPTLHCNFLPWT
jgi:hypothetical protein